MRLNDDYSVPASVHSFQKVEGTLALDLSEVVLEEQLSAGDHIAWFSLPDGRLLVCKDPKGTPVRRISSAYIYLDADINVEEK